jgi:beta-lactamase class A
VGAAALLVALACGSPGVTDPGLERRIAERAAGFRGVMGVYAKDLRSGRSAALQGETRFPSASLIKLAVMTEVHEQRAEGRLAPDMRVTLREADKVGDAIVLNGLHAGSVLTLDDLLFTMIAHSDNTATNLLVERVGTAAVDARLAAYGLTQTLLFRPTFRDGRADVHPELEREFGLGMTTPRELALLMERIAEGRVVSRAACDAMLAMLREQKDRTMIPRALPLESGVSVANKTGEDLEKQPDARGVHRFVRGDVALVEGPGVRYVLAILTRQGEDTSPSVDNAALTTGGSVARIVHEAFAQGR